MAKYKEGLAHLGVLLLANTLIALTIWALMDAQDFLAVWVVSQCIGLSCALLAKFAHHLVAQRRADLLFPIAFLAALCGVPLGAWVAFQLGFPAQGNAVDVALGSIWRYILLSSLVSFAFHAYYSNRARLQKLEEVRREAEMRELAVQKAALHARLRALQAQIEPHFLFNTLANLHSLIGRDDQAARSLLERLNEYLRATLVHSRAEQASLGNECEMLRAYLTIHALRMGSRLAWEIRLPDALASLPFPPMLLQPLVENAIIHGIEPKIDGGNVSLQVEAVGSFLRCEICDDGVGIIATGEGSGVGLENVRERLHSLYGASARLELRDNVPCGVIAELWISLEAPAP